MERLTKICKDTDGKYLPYTIDNYSGVYPDSTLGKLVERLAYYEDLEEQDRLIVLPCKFGTTVYFIAFDKCYNGICCWFRDGKCIKADSLECCPKEVLETKYSLEMYQRGIRVFLTREEAEVALNNI